MDASEELGRGPWRQVLRAGGLSTIARWTRTSGSGVAEHVTVVPGEVAGTLRGLADELGLALSAVLLAAHSKVLSALTGEAELTTGLVTRPGGSAVPCRLSAAPGSWPALVGRTHRIETATRELPELPEGALDGLLGEFGLPGMPFETVFDPTGADSVLTDGELDAGTVLRVAVSDREGELALRLRYRTEEFDAGTAARIAGYHLRAARAARRWALLPPHPTRASGRGRGPGRRTDSDVRPMTAAR